jgi:hypothetical protein
MYAAPMAFLLLIFKIQFDIRRAKKKYDIDGSTALRVEVVETADSYSTDSDSGSDDSDSGDDK